MEHATATRTYITKDVKLILPLFSSSHSQSMSMTAYTYYCLSNRTHSYTLFSFEITHCFVVGCNRTQSLDAHTNVHIRGVERRVLKRFWTFVSIVRLCLCLMFISLPRLWWFSGRSIGTMRHQIHNLENFAQWGTLKRCNKCRIFIISSLLLCDMWCLQ